MMHQATIEHLAEQALPIFRKEWVLIADRHRLDRSIAWHADRLGIERRAFRAEVMAFAEAMA